MTIPPDVAAQLAKYRGAQAARSTEVATVAERHDFLVLYADIGGAIGVRPDGEFVEVGWDDDHAVPLESLRWRDIALVTGAKTYPEIARLLPVRTRGDRTCDQCHGTGKVAVQGTTVEKLMCKCAGLGWIPEYWEKWSHER